MSFQDEIDQIDKQKRDLDIKKQELIQKRWEEETLPALEETTGKCYVSSIPYGSNGNKYTKYSKVLGNQPGTKRIWVEEFSNAGTHENSAGEITFEVASRPANITPPSANAIARAKNVAEKYTEITQEEFDKARMELIDSLRNIPSRTSIPDIPKRERRYNEWGDEDDDWGGKGEVECDP